MIMEQEEFTLEMLSQIFINAAVDALGETIEAVAAELGVSQIQGMPIQEFYGRRRRSIAEHLVADFADGHPAMASQMKAAWDKVDLEQEKQREADKKSQQ